MPGLDNPEGSRAWLFQHYDNNNNNINRKYGLLLAVENLVSVIMYESNCYLPLE